MREHFILWGAAIAIMFLVGCGGKPEIEKPEVTIQRPEGAPPPITSGAAPPRITPGTNQQVTIAPQLTLPRIQTPGGTLAAATLPPVTVSNVSPVTKYDSSQMISTFATQYLGTSVDVSRAAGGKGNVSLPSTQQGQIDAAVTLAGQIAAGTITASSSQGAAEVAVGSGSISGDLNADMSGASLGAYSMVVRSAPPTTADAALALVRQQYPALAKITLQQQTSAQGAFVFYATTSHPGVDWKSKQVTTVAEGIMAGMTREGPATAIWVVIGNGTFATSVKP